VSAEPSVFERLANARHLLRAKDIADAMDVSVGTIFKAAKNGSLPCVRLGTSVRFDGRKVVAWLQGGQK